MKGNDFKAELRSETTTLTSLYVTSVSIRYSHLSPVFTFLHFSGETYFFFISTAQDIDIFTLNSTQIYNLANNQQKKIHYIFTIFYNCGSPLHVFFLIEIRLKVSIGHVPAIASASGAFQMV